MLVKQTHETSQYMVNEGEFNSQNNSCMHSRGFRVMKNKIQDMIFTRKPGVDHHEINLIDMITSTKDDLCDDQLHSSMNLREINIPNLSLMQNIYMKMNQLKKILEFDER